MAHSATNTEILAIPFQHLLDICRNINRFEHTYQYSGENAFQNGCQVRISHGFSMSSYGENITVTLLPLDMVQTQVKVDSCCIMPTQLIDYGKNKNNVRLCFDIFKKY